MIPLLFPVTRLVQIRGVKHPVVVTLVPCRGERDTLLALRPHRMRVPYVITLADCYRLAALWHGNKERAAKAAARKAGVPWKRARKDFLTNLLPPLQKRKRKLSPTVNHNKKP